jgi:hypothetical protein
MPLSITAQPVSQLIAIGQPTSFSVVAAYTGGPATIYYQWNKENTPVQGQNTATLSFSAITSDDSGVYTCTIYNSADSTVLTTNPVVLASSILDNIELQMKIAILGMTKVGGYNWDWQVVNQPDEATGPGYPRVNMESPAESNIDGTNTPNAQAYTNEVVFVLWVKGNQAWSSNANFTIRSNLRSALDDLKRLFGNNSSVNNSCEEILYRSSQVVALNLNDVQRPSNMRVQFLVRYCQDRLNPLIRAGS